MDLNSGKLITRSKVTEIPITERVINAVNNMGFNQGFPKDGLKLSNKMGVVYHDNDWFAGVDYMESDPNDNGLLTNKNDENDIDNMLNEVENNLMNEDEGDNEFSNMNEDNNDDVNNEEEDETIEEGIEELSEILYESPENNMDDNDEVEIIFEEEKNNENEEESDDDEVIQLRRSNRVRRPVDRLIPSMSGKSYIQEHNNENDTRKVTFCDTNKDYTMKTNMGLEKHHNLMITTSPNPSEDSEYTLEKAPVIAHVMYTLHQEAIMFGTSFGQQYILQVGLKRFGDEGYNAAVQELEQLYKRSCFSPIGVGELSKVEKAKAMKALMLLTEKKDGTKKGRLVYNGKPTREWLSHEDASSPTATLESIMITAVIDAYEQRDVMCNDIPNAFIQAPMPVIREEDERVIMKICGILVSMLIKLDPTLYGPYVVFEKGEKVIYVRVLKAIYGMLQAALLWYQKFRTDLESEGYVFNPYDSCVANKVINGKQHTVVFHVDDLKCSHVDAKVNDNFLKWLNTKYGEMSEVKAHRGKIFNYLGMKLNYGDKGKVKIDMVDYIMEMISSFPENITGSKVKTPADNNLFILNDNDNHVLNDEQRETYHTMVAKGIFLAKRGRPDIQTTNAYLSTKVKEPTKNDWNKLRRMLQYLYNTSDLILSLSADNLNVIKWYVDASYAVHPDYKSHTGAIMTMGNGAITSISRKQKLNTNCLLYTSPSPRDGATSRMPSSA